MHPLRSIVLYFGAIFIGGALLAPAIYKLVQVNSHTSQFTTHLAAYPFKRYLTRIFMVIALSCLWPFLRALGIRSCYDLGLGRRPERGRDLALGFATGFLSLGVVATIALSAHGRLLQTDHSRIEVAKHFMNAGLAATLVAFVEELLFRGALLGGLRKVFHWMFALSLSSLIFASLHFLRTPPANADIHWYSGFTTLAQMAGGFAEPPRLFPAFLNLALVGLILGVAFQYSRALYFPIGLHGGWIFWQKSYGFITQDTPTTGTWFWGTGKLIDGWLTFGVLGLTLVMLWYGPGRANRSATRFF